jgi:hypothetical protein
MASASDRPRSKRAGSVSSVPGVTILASPINIVVSNPPPTGFPASPIHGPEFDLPTQRFTVDLPNGTSVILESSDLGTVLTDAAALETAGGNQVFNRFDIPQLRGADRGLHEKGLLMDQRL